MRGIWYSIGSSIVQIFTSGVFKIFKTLYKLVVLPEPVGPVERIKPCGRLMFNLTTLRASRRKPKASRLKGFADSKSKRITTFSPLKTGIMETRKESLYSSFSILKRPSWGKRCSSIFKLESTLSRATTPGKIFFGKFITSFKIPSTR